MLVVATLLWEPNATSFKFSRCYDETWVKKLFNGFERNLDLPFRKVLYTDRIRPLHDDVEQFVIPGLGAGGYGDCIRPYELDEPMILVGLDTIATGNVDHLARYCLNADVIALPRDPYRLEQACNAVALVPAGNGHVYERHRGQNDMEWMRTQPHVFLDDLWPGHVQSYKGTVRQTGLGDTRIVYFHGEEKPHQLPHVEWVREHWR
ncbi:hypothetical protein C7441_11022 [Pseudaminobacter salicylatoxidans]|uniref:Uncharacterized protein n=1 Tax=Pseudaminobacter salicylatoxidans TaxID=93369 RepID=A0A316C0G3_PSESE|nr:hypothetical protein [Pseudaminobacter salicylatoxidans]PWJ81490.1 hypothetical protein C7441_11022 [Pseudaminobacter salicylatoxidans]